jgi:hypothetical protein
LVGIVAVTMALKAAPPAAVTAVTPEIIQQDKAFLESVERSTPVPSGETAVIASAPVVVAEASRQTVDPIAETAPADPGVEKLDRPARKDSAPVPAPIASKSTTPTRVKRDTSVAGRASAPSRQAASIRTGKPRSAAVKPRASSLEPSESRAELSDPIKSRTVRTESPAGVSRREVEVRRAEPVQHREVQPKRRLFDGLFDNHNHNQDHEDD